MSIASQLVKLADNKAAIKAAIEAKSPTVPPTDSLAQWPEAIASIPSGGGSAGNGLPLGCPRIDLVQLSDTYEEIYIVEDARAAPAGSTHGFNFYWKADADCTVGFFEVTIADDGTVTQTQNGQDHSTTANVQVGRTVYLAGGQFNVVRLRISASEVKFTLVNAGYGQSASFWRIAAKTNSSTPTPSDGSTWGVVNQVSFLRYYYHKPLTSSMITGDLLYSHALLHCTLAGNFNLNFYSDTFLERLKLNTTFGSSFVGFNSVSAPEVDFSECDFSAVTSIAANRGFGFYCCPSIIMPSNPDKGMRISHTINPSRTPLTLPSLISILGSLYDHTTAGTGQTPTLTIGATNLATLEASQEGQAALAAAQAKGWNIA